MKIEDLYENYRAEAAQYALSYGINVAPTSIEWDAFRHAYASASMANEYGYTVAEFAGYAVEFGGLLQAILKEENSLNSHNMDLWNNNVGRDIGIHSTTKDEMAQKVFNALNSGSLITDENNDPRSYFNDYPHDPFPDNHTTIPSDINGLFNAAIQARYGSPLTLDLDGDGIETVGIDVNHLVLFDNNNDGIKTATGWVKSDDALLVLDINSNGTIDNGSELFGDNTLIYDSNNQPIEKAANGFDALAQYDTDKNGKIDETDSIYTNLKIWQDYNQDGISQANELSSLNANAITSIGLSYEASSIISNNNLYALNGTYQKDNTTQTITDVYFIQENFYREFTDTISLTEAASALPQMQGSGLVRDLQQAASMQTTEGSALTELLTQYSSFTTRDEQMAMIDTLLKAWGETSGFKDIMTEAAENGYTLTTSLDANQFAMLSILEQFNGRHFYHMPWDVNLTAEQNVHIDAEAKTIYVEFRDGSLSLLEQAYQKLVESVYGGLVLQTRLTPYLDSITINIDENGLIFDVALMITQLKTLQLTSPRDALIDQLELIQYAGKNLSIMGWNWSETLQTMITQIGTQVDVKAVFSELGYMNSETSNIIYDVEGKNHIAYNGDAAIILVGLDGNDTIYSGYGDDLINGGKGDDQLYGNNGNDTYIFNLGDEADTIYDSSWNSNNKDTIRFGEGISSDNLDVTRSNDNLVLTIQGTTDKITVSEYFMDTSSKIEEFVFADGTTLTSQQIESMAVFIGTDGDNSLYGYELSDKFIGGKGNDYLDGGYGNDTYIFNLGDGQDTICEQNYSSTDTIEFGEGISSNNLDVTRVNYDLILTIQGTIDKITVSEYFMDTSSKIEEFVFADGTTLTSQQIESMVVLRGTDGNDTLYGYETNDVLIGGKGNDYLDGQDGNDTYVFNLGDGQDTIYDYSGNDKIVLGEGIASDNLDVTRSNDNLLLAILGTTDKITVNGYFMGASYKIEEFVFNDGTTLTSQQIESMVVLRGTDGNDTLYGYELSDKFIGGKGNDILDGQDGNDTYLFNLGDGADTIYDSSWNTNNKDTIRFGEGISSDSLDVTRINDNLLLAILGTTDKITVNDYFMGAYSKIEEFAFADGTTLTSQQIESMAVFIGTDGNDIINGSMESDTINGKKGDDQLYGDDGDDTYIFNLGDGADTIYDSSWNTNNKDIIRFGDGITSDSLDVTRINNNLIIAILGTTDKITVSEYFMDTSSKIEEFVFADGTTLTSQQIESMVVLRGTDGNDIINGSMESDTINGKKGDDQLYGDDGDDTYIFNLGDGADTIYDSSWNTNNKDIIRFGDGITSDSLDVTRINDNLVLAILGTTDKITVSEYFMDTSSKIEEFAFADGTTLTSQQIESMAVFIGTDGDDNLYGYELSDRFIGGKGNDILDGQDGNDTYIFNLGDGQDTIYDQSWNIGNNDIIIFGDGIVAADVTITQDQSNLYFTLNNTEDKITIASYFDALEYQIEQVTFTDGTLWNSTMFNQIL